MRITVATVFLSYLILTVSSTSMFKSATRSLQTVQPAAALRLAVDYYDSDVIFLNATTTTDAGVRSKYLVVKGLIEKTKAYYAMVLTVKSPKVNYTWPDVVVSTTKTLKGMTANFDTWVYLSVAATGATLVKGAPKAYDIAPSLGRPVVGLLEVSLDKVTATTATLLSQQGAFISAFYNILVFHDDLFGKFIDTAGVVIPKATTIGQSAVLKTLARPMYKGPAVVAWAKIHLSFAGTLPGVIFENTEPVSSRWEQMWWPSEGMSAVAPVAVGLSELSLSMATDSGWYTYLVANAQALEFGKGAAIDIQTDTCPAASIEGFCTPADSVSCSPDMRFKAKCGTDALPATLSETCLYKKLDLDCTIVGGAGVTGVDNLGDTSRCIVTTQGTAGAVALPSCAKTSCTGTGATLALIFTFDASKTATCTVTATSGTAVPPTVYSTTPAAGLTLACPNDSQIPLICARMVLNQGKCPLECSNKGLCLGAAAVKKCFCVYGWSGVDCATANAEETDAKLQVAATAPGVVATTTTATSTGGRSYLVLSVAMYLCLLSTFLY
jgi:hypothetical protein